jgi:hypothetical protein
MWQRFTERARRIVFFAQEEAARLGENYVGTEHLLLGLVRESDSVGSRILDHLGISLGRIRQEIERQVTRGTGNLGQDMQLTPRAKRVIDLAYEEARQLNNNYIGTEHLLLGMVREGDGLAARVLTKLGATLERVRQQVWQMQEQEGNQTGSRIALPRKGDLGILRGIEGHPNVELATSAESIASLAEVMETRDHHGYLELQSAGRFVLVPDGTWAKMLGTAVEKGVATPRLNAVYVRLLDGERGGQTGWVLPERFENQGPDPRPFPPGAPGTAPPPPKPPEPPAGEPPTAADPPEPPAPPRPVPPQAPSAASDASAEPGSPSESRDIT